MQCIEASAAVYFEVQHKQNWTRMAAIINDIAIFQSVNQTDLKTTMTTRDTKSYRNTSNKGPRLVNAFDHEFQPRGLIE
jgi:hypothetical protein